jgi:hypothetical protein
VREPVANRSSLLGRRSAYNVLARFAESSLVDLVDFEPDRRVDVVDHPFAPRVEIILRHIAHIRAR